MREWPTTALGSVATIDRDGVDPARIEDGTPYVGLENIRSGGGLVDVRSVARGELASTKFRITPDHVLFGKLRPYLAKVARPDFEGICSTDILPIRPGPRLDRDYLAHFLLRPQSVAWATSRSSGANLPRLSPNSLAQMHIPVPPLAEQRRVAGLLDGAEALRAKRGATLALLDSLAQSIFVDMFGDPSDGTAWPVVPLETLCRRVTDGTHQPPKWSPSGHPFLFVANIVTGEIEFDTVKFISDETHRELTRRCPIEVGDVLYSTVGSYGVPAVVRDARKFAFQRHIAHLKPDPALLDSEFLRAMLASPDVRRQADEAARGIAQKTVNLADIRRFMVIHPDMNMQRLFTERAAAVRQARKTYLESRSSLARLFSSLEDRAFRGQL